ncbi:TIGR03668 family PPOX class F420-dependent oxidoreductase [Halosimplex aquaticum]|uniref:TIGR03668 family PPOX class F420-dependent oxidoreductase n=1 Tax=Halosimplex aquaticum TaxID=3026162 RepID=A0ABD5Y5M2_9EURY|nr:TIGR03668 family PPOX class F420-dependent oxidoreductase [Halosimplex aquaticum]
MFTDAERRYLESARVARLATADAEGRPNAVPVCFALVDGEDDESAAPDGETAPWIASPIDEKPKGGSPETLRRVRDVRENGRVALVADHYVEDWDRLGWVQVRGTASVLAPGDASHDAAVGALRGEYDQYADHALGERPALRIDPGHVRSWGRITDL